MHPATHGFRDSTKKMRDTLLREYADSIAIAGLLGFALVCLGVWRQRLAHFQVHVFADLDPTVKIE